jgi:hypothetical protein
MSKMHTETDHASTSRSEKGEQEGDDEGPGSAGKKRRKKKWPDDVRVDLSCCKYEVLRIAVQKMGWQEATDGKAWHVFWTGIQLISCPLSQMLFSPFLSGNCRIMQAFFTICIGI